MDESSTTDPAGLDDDLLTLPQVAVLFKRTPDRLRDLAGGDPKLGRLFRWAGRTRVLRRADLPAVAAPQNPPAAPATPENPETPA